MDLSPTLWGVIILVATVVSGGLMMWSSKPKKNRSLLARERLGGKTWK